MKKTFTIIILLCCSFGVHATVAEADALLKQFEAQSKPSWKTATKFLEMLHKEDPGYTVVYFTSTSEEKEIMCEVYSNACDYYYSLRDYDQAIAYGEKALPYIPGTDWDADCRNLLSMAYLGKSDYTKAAAYAKQCYALDTKTGDPDMMSSSLNTIAGIYMAANQPDEAEKYILKALDMTAKVNNPKRRAVIEGMASEIYHAQVNDAEALKHINIACDLEKKLGNEDKLLVRLVQKASVLNGLKRYAETERLLRDIFPSIEQLGDKHTLGIALNKLGMALFSQHRQTEAVPVFRRAAGIFVELGDLGNELHARRGLYESLWKLNPDSAKIELDRFDLLKDSLYRTDAAESLSHINAELDNDWLTHDNALKQTIISNLKVIIALCIITAALLAVGIWQWMRRRMRIKVEALQVIIDELQGTHSTQQPSDLISPSTTPLPQTDKDFLTHVIAVVTDALPDGDFSVEAIADKMCMTRGNLNRKVKDIAGTTTQQFVMQVRLEQASQLLRDTELPVNEVGFKCGFDSAVSFSRAFKRKNGTTPSQFRQSN